jgi:anaerobic carbon-monoxide dehydrogenase iron sulfur subunit
MARVIAVDVDKCIGCRSCQVACALAHSGAESLFEAVQQQPLAQARVSVVSVGGIAVPVQCRHCDDAPCVDKCPKDAMQKPEPDGPVTVDVELCIGCGVCIKVCPLGNFGTITMAPDGDSVVKCDLCIDRLNQGLEPACVEACPTGALVLMDVADAQAAGLSASVEDLLAVLESKQEGDTSPLGRRLAGSRGK